MDQLEGPKVATLDKRYVTKCSEWGPRDPGYTLKKLHEALHVYFSCIGMSEDRLYDAYLQIHLLTAADFPDSLQPRFRALIDAMTNRHDTTKPGEQGYIGDARNTLKGIAPSDEEEIIHLLTSLIKEVERSMGREGEGRTSSFPQQPSAA